MRPTPLYVEYVEDDSPHSGSRQEQEVCIDEEREEFIDKKVFLKNIRIRKLVVGFEHDLASKMFLKVKKRHYEGKAYKSLFNFFMDKWNFVLIAEEDKEEGKLKGKSLLFKKDQPSPHWRDSCKNKCRWHLESWMNVDLNTTINNESDLLNFLDCLSEAIGFIFLFYLRGSSESLIQDGLMLLLEDQIHLVKPF